jgi:hypothetical protein
VSRRSSLPWAPTSVPALRKQWCHFLGEGIERLRQQPGTPAELLEQAGRDLAGIEKSTQSGWRAT